MRGVFLGVLLGAVLAMAGGPAGAAMYGEGFAPCGEQASTSGTVDCLAAKTRSQDQRLNAAYRDLQKRIDPDQRQPLIEAQRLWVRYRDANCRFYAERDGSIRQIEAAECLRAMTADRAGELERAMTGP